MRPKKTLFTGSFLFALDKCAFYYLNSSMNEGKPSRYALDKLQKTALSLMTVMILVTFVGANLQAILWQSSHWLVSTVLPATVIDLTNQERSELSQAPLKRNATLDAAAKLKAEHMAQNEYFSHFSPDGVSPWYWFDQAGYVYAHAGENLAIHFTDSSEVVDAWMKSPTHRENIVNRQYTEIGVGTAKGTYEGYDTVYVVQLFGSPGAAPVRVAQKPAPEQVAQIPQAPAPSPVAVAEVELEPEPASQSPAASEPEPVPTQPAEPAESTDVPATTPEEPVIVSEDAQVAVEDSVAEPESTPVDEAPEVALESEPVAAQEVVIIESPIISTSSGLAVANITTDTPSHAGATAVASFATKPNTLLQFVYLGLGVIIFLLLTASLVLEARQLRLVQVAYSVLLLIGMGGLWFLNSILTSGAVIV